MKIKKFKTSFIFIAYSLYTYLVPTYSIAETIKKNEEIVHEKIKIQKERKNNEDISLTLHPLHKSGLSILTEKTLREHRLLDNDGNEYITHWQVIEERIDAFKTSTKKCDVKYSKNRIFSQANLITSYQIENLRPSIFKAHTRCIAKEGFKLDYSEGFIPDSYLLRVYHSHSNTGQYLPVGGSISIIKKGIQFLDVYKDTKACQSITETSPKKNVVEQHTSDFVSVEVYFKTMLDCLNSKFYKTRIQI